MQAWVLPIAVATSSSSVKFKKRKCVVLSIESKLQCSSSRSSRKRCDKCEDHKRIGNWDFDHWRNWLVMMSSIKLSGSFTYPALVRRGFSVVSSVHPGYPNFS